MEWHRTPPYGRRDRAPFVLIVAITACGTQGMRPAERSRAQMAVRIANSITIVRVRFVPYLFIRLPPRNVGLP